MDLCIFLYMDLCKLEQNMLTSAAVFQICFKSNVCCSLVQLLGDLNGIVEMRAKSERTLGKEIPVLFTDGRLLGVGFGTPMSDGVELVYSDLFELAGAEGVVNTAGEGFTALLYFLYKVEVGSLSNVGC